ncbi:MAG: hypothetical protein HY553_18580 [Elusimicrobia bacterium]|nr:hypothetical protein [Elusimicrobiota bacterium]
MRAWLLSLSLLLTAGRAAAAPDFDQGDPGAWAVQTLRETPDGPRLKIWEPQGPAARVRRNADGTLRDPFGAFPDGRESARVLAEVDEFLALPKDAAPERKRRAFSSVAAAAERWARFWLPEPQANPGKREARRLIRDLALRMVANPAVPRFNEFVDPGLAPGVAAETGNARGWRERGGRAAWRLGPREDATLSVTYDESARNSLAFELTRLHEWVHVIDMARLGATDDDGRPARAVHDERFGFFTEAQAYALDFLAQRAFLADDDCNLTQAAAELGKDVRDVAFEEYFLYEVGRGGIYEWASGLVPNDPAGVRRERGLSRRLARRDERRAHRFPRVRYLRTIAP